MRRVALGIALLLLCLPLATAQNPLVRDQSRTCGPGLLDDDGCTTGPHMTAGGSVRMGLGIVRQGEPPFNATVVNRLTWDTGHLTLTCDISDVHFICDLAGQNPPRERPVFHECDAVDMPLPWRCSIEYRGYV